MAEYTRQHYGYATTGKPTQEPGKPAVPSSRNEDAPKAPPPPKEKR